MNGLSVSCIFLLLLLGLQTCTGAVTAANETHRLFNTRLSWNDARAQCQKRDMVLATMNTRLSRYLTDEEGSTSFDDDIWVGAYDTDKAQQNQDDSGYAWAASCQTLAGSWTDWKDGEPQNTADSFCVAIIKNDFRWRTSKCSESHSFLCGPPSGSIEERASIRLTVERLEAENAAESDDPDIDCSEVTTARSTDAVVTTESTTTPPEDTTQEQTSETAGTTPITTTATTAAAATTTAATTAAATTTAASNDTIAAFLLLDVSKLSSTRRKKESAPDPRVSSALIGSFQLLLFAAFYGFLFLSDFVRVYEDVRYGVHYKKQKQKRKRKKQTASE